MANKKLKQETPLRLGRLDKNVVVVLQKNMTRLLRLDEEMVVVNKFGQIPFQPLNYN